MIEMISSLLLTNSGLKGKEDGEIIAPLTLPSPTTGRGFGF